MKLTDRQREVLDLMCQGLTNKEIGKRLYITERSVKGHRHRMYQRFGLTYEKNSEIRLIVSYLRGELEQW